MENSLSLIRFGVMNFFAILINSRPFQPISTLLIKIVEGLISAEQEPDIKMKKRIEWIYQHTHKKVDFNLSIIELAVFRNLDKGLNREIDIGNKTFNLTELYKYLDEISKELSTMVINIAKKYSIDIPMTFYGSSQSQKISLE